MQFPKAGGPVVSGCHPKLAGASLRLKRRERRNEIIAQSDKGCLQVIFFF